jgi:hypothetical protein
MTSKWIRSVMRDNSYSPMQALISASRGVRPGSIDLVIQRLADAKARAPLVAAAVDQPKLRRA